MCLRVLSLCGCCLLTLFSAANAQEKRFPKFEERIIDPNAGDVVYAVTHADVDGDAKPDIVAVTENAVYWYQAPGWKKRVIIRDQTVRDNVCIAAHDIDGDGQVDFALGAGWLNGRNQGTIQWLQRTNDLDKPWKVHFIGEIPWTHRMRFADVLGTGKPQLTVSPLNKTEGDGVKLTAFEIPENPTMDRWPATVIDDSLNRMHNHWHANYDNGIIDTLTASQEGITIFRGPPMLFGSGPVESFHTRFVFRRISLSDGASGEKPTEKGAGEVKTGKLKNGKILIGTVEPMHGNLAVIYVQQKAESLDYDRHVLDDTLGRGHAVWLADFNGDGNDEIVIGHSDPATGEIKGPGVYVYQAVDDSGTKWTKHVIDNGGVAVEDAFAVDLTGDNLPDIVAGGRATHNVKLYVNQGVK